MGLRIAERWFEMRRVDDAITLLWEPHVVPLMRCNIWHVRGRDRDLLIDTGMGVASLREAARSLLEKPVTAVATHTHADHIGGHFEFADCLVHRAEAERLSEPRGRGSLRRDAFAADELAMLRRAGYEVAETLITALPHAGYALEDYRIRPARPTRIVEEGSIVDIGDRHFEVLHLPGHSPGSIGLWEAATGTLFSGDAVYDGPLLDELATSNIRDYVATMRRLRELPVTVVHAGHDPSFGRDRLVQLVDRYLKCRDRRIAS
ncbi:MAG TPA: MBL fold metallo-hydrolase [Stellaceae bacterium]|nr:MBL fold metallo-hydrolase [Stellaceae bacterium]